MPTDRARFEELVRSTSRLIAAAARRVCGRRHGELVPDVEQEVYLALWKRLGSGKEIRHPTSYVYKVALTTALAVVRRWGREQPFEEGELEERPAPSALDQGLEPAERRRLLEQVLASVGKDEARALRAHLAGFDHVEIAALYGWSESVARHRVYRTLERLRASAREKGGKRDD